MIRSPAAVGLLALGLVGGALTAQAAPDDANAVGVVDPTTGVWYLRDDATAETTSFYYGNPGDVPFTGDWDCDGVETPGLYRQSDGYVYLRNTNTQGVADVRFFFGNPGDIPLPGDFDGDGCDTVSLYRPAQSRVFIVNALGSGDAGLGSAEHDYVFGNPGDQPFVGDFDGDGVDTVGLYRRSTGLVYFRNDHTAGVADEEFVYGNPADRILAGAWAGGSGGADTVGIFRNGTFYLRFSNTPGNADDEITYGNRTLLPVTGRFGPLPGGDPPPDLGLTILSRSAWEAAPADVSGMTEHTVEYLTVHHAGLQSSTTGPPRFRSWQQLHQGRGWGDIAYHYIIGIDGTVYEGRDPRYEPDTATEYDTTGHLGIVVEGNFDIDQPTPAQLESLARVLAWASLEFGVSPETISGHRDHAATSCPGGNLHPFIASGDLQREVEKLLSGSGRWLRRAG